MNPRHNPALALSLLRSSLIDPGRIERITPKRLDSYKNKAFQKLITSAFTVPLYLKKYKSAGLQLQDIHGIKDIVKLPFVSRQDFRLNFPDGVLPAGYDKQQGHVICTGGTTGKYCCNNGSQPVCLYTDLPTMLRGFGTTLREHRAFHLNWNTARIAHLGNFNPYKSDEFVQHHVQPYLKNFVSFDNYLNMSASDPINDIITKLEAFKPDAIISYPAIFQEIAYLKTKGKATRITPRLLFVGGRDARPLHQMVRRDHVRLPHVQRLRLL